MKALSVWVNEQRIGTLQQFGEWEEEFHFDQSYVRLSPNERPVLGQLFEDRFPGPIRVGGPIGWFTHLLPQGMMLRWQCRQHGIPRDDSFELLRLLGRNLPGAVQVIDDANVPLEFQILNAASSDDHLPKATVFENNKFSLAGMQWKWTTKLSSDPRGKGATVAAEQKGRSVIAKFESPGYDAVPQNEFATMRWAALFGLEVPAFEMCRHDEFEFVPDSIPRGDGNVFVIDRFDRTDDQRNHLEDFAQVLDRPISMIYEADYETIAHVLAVVCPESVIPFLRQLIFTVCSGNGDAHLKNFSLVYRHLRQPRLSPVYDQLATVVHGDQGLALRLGGSKDWMIESNRFDELIRISRTVAEIPDDFVHSSVKQAMDAFQSIQPLYPARHQTELLKHFQRVPIVSSQLNL